MTVDREKAAICSALWAAAGDALGWITEHESERRAGAARITEPVAWRRQIGGWHGVAVDFPAGAYSDDTQLRLAVCRAIRGNGAFDPEAFAKIELTVWQSYALGAGLGSLIAASNLTHRDVNWFSNFYDKRGRRYTDGGGNGAAMRIQPHVWAASDLTADGYLWDVLRNAITTHGHPHGFAGAAFHAMCLAETLSTEQLAGPSAWFAFFERLPDLVATIEVDGQLTVDWRSAWEKAVGRSLADALQKLSDQTRRDLDTVSALADGDDPSTYELILDALQCRTPGFWGSGVKTAIAAATLAWLYREQPVEQALTTAANTRGSDTDTIATMTGALLGCIADSPPGWEIQDRDYIVRGARRLAAIAGGKPQDSFPYPDLAHWLPSADPDAAILSADNNFAVAGLGRAVPEGRGYETDDAIWQWVRLEFGQTILIKRRPS